MYEPVTVIFSSFRVLSSLGVWGAAVAVWATARGATPALVNNASIASRFLAERAFIVRSDVAVVCGKTMAQAMAYSVGAFGA
jgi:hypothetical protein